MSVSDSYCGLPQSREDMDKPTLETVPVETLEGICHFFDNTAPLKNLRLASRELCAKTQNTFVKRQFTNLDFCISEDDFTNLVEISKHPTFSKAVRSLRVRPSYLSFDFDLRRFTNSPAAANSSYEPAFAVFLKEQHAQTLWRSKACDVRSLATAFQNMPRLERLYIGFEDPETAKEATSPATGQLINIRDGVYTPEQRERCNSTSHGFWVVLAALNRTKLDIKELHAGGGQYTIQSSFLRIGQMWTATVRECLSNITVLSLGIDASQELSGSEDWFGEDSRLADFLSGTPELQSLSLYYERQDAAGYNRDDSAEQIYWSLSGVCDCIRFPKLRSLKLKRACLVAEDFIIFLVRHKETLEDLELDGLCALDFPDEPGVQVARAIGAVLDELPKLDSLCLTQISTERGCVLFGPEHADCEYCDYPKISDPACARSELRVKGTAVQNSTTAKLLTTSRVRHWTDDL